MSVKHGRAVVLLLAVAYATAPLRAQTVTSKIEGMWSNPPQTALGALCAFFCTDAGIDRLNMLLDDPANDARPFGQLQAEAFKHQTDNYIRPRLMPAALKTYPVDPADDPGLLRCEPWGLARQMTAPHQLEIRRRGPDRLELHYGEWDAHRTVYMDGRKQPANHMPSRLGFSVGHWDGEALIVETSNVAANWTPWQSLHSDQLHVVERFARVNSPKGDTLLLTATIDDPWGLRESVVIKKIWAWSPTSKIAPYDSCVPITAVKKGTRQ